MAMQPEDLNTKGNCQLHVTDREGCKTILNMKENIQNGLLTALIWFEGEFYEKSK